MKDFKNFFIRMCDLEGVSPKELQEITGKSKSVVYEWLNYDNKTSLPTKETLLKVLFRLGLTMDDYINCRSDKLVDSSLYRTYDEHMIGDEFGLYITESVLTANNYEYILDCFLDDCISFKSMLNNYLNGLEIDLEEFDLICKHLKPQYSSDAVFIDELTDVAVDFFSSSMLEEYKLRTELYNELVEDDPEYAFDHFHDVWLPRADYFVLHVAKTNPYVVKRFLSVLNETEKNNFLEVYFNYYMKQVNFDINKKILKYLIKQGCKLRENVDEETKELYNQIIENI